MNALSNQHASRVLSGLMMAAVMTIGCSDSSTNSTGVDESSQLTGTWNSQQFAIRSTADPAISFDLVGAGGTLLFSIQPLGTFTGTAVLPGTLVGMPDLPSISFPLSGVITLVDEEIMTINFVPEIPPVFMNLSTEYEFVGDQIGFTDATSFDFDQDGILEEAMMEAVLVRN